MFNIGCDLRYAFRSLVKSPGFTAVAVLTLALGVGANTAVFSLINAVLLRPLPYPQPDRLVLIWEKASFLGLQDSPVAPANYYDWKARSRSFEEMGALEFQSYRLTADGQPEIAEGALITPEVLRALRIRPVLGRSFEDSDNRHGAPKVALISDGFWRRRFGADPIVIGRAVPLNGEKHTIVGVLGPGMEPPAQYSSKLGEIWTPLASFYAPAELAARGRHNWMVIARLRAGATLEQADAEMAAVGARLAVEYPNTNKQIGAFVAPLRDHFVSSRRDVLSILFGTVAVVLLIACSNLANLLLCRAATRSREVAVRAALGAGTWQLARQFFFESLLLSAGGTALGLYFATGTFQFLSHLAPGNMTRLNAVELDWRVLLFTVSIAVLTTVAFSLVPIIQLRRLDLIEPLKRSGRSMATVSGSSRVRALLISSEVALAFVLLISAGLLLQTLARLRGVDVGYRTENVLTLSMPTSDSHKGNAKSVAYQREILQRVTAIPGVASAGFTNHIPLVEKGDIGSIGAEGRNPDEKFTCRNRKAGPGYLRTMGIPLLRGRDIDERDGPAAPPVVLVNETLARLLWPGQEALGRQIVFGPEDSAEVIGVVGDIHQAGLDVPPQPEYYASSLQSEWPPRALAIQTTIDPGGMTATVRQAIWSVDPKQPVTKIATMHETLDTEVFQQRLQTTLLSVFAGLALLLAGVGLHGLLAHLVAQQTSEIGLRVALGAEPWSVFSRVVGRALRLTAFGLIGGIVAALAVSRLITSFLFGVAPTDPATYLAVTLVLIVAAGVASYVPARRAMQVDPIVALRQE